MALPRLHHTKRSILHNQPLILTPLNFNHFRINLFLFLINGGQVFNFMCLQFDLHEHRLEAGAFDILEVLDLFLTLATPFTLQTVNNGALGTIPHRYFLRLRQLFTSRLLIIAEDAVKTLLPLIL